MLDAIAPEDKIGYVQGLNNASMNFGMALAPWAFGEFVTSRQLIAENLPPELTFNSRKPGVLADYAGTNVSISTAIGFSILAALANSPLCWHPMMGKPKKPKPLAQRKLPDEDDELFQQLIEGDIVDPELAFQINQDRGLHGLPSIVPRVKPYDSEKDHLEDISKGNVSMPSKFPSNGSGPLISNFRITISKGAGETFKFRLGLYDRVLAGLAEAENDPENLVFSKDELIELLNTLKGDDQAVIDKASGDLGKWMGEYLADNGYSPHTTSVLVKQMFMASFPPLMRDKEFDDENVEEWLLRSRKVLSRYVCNEEKNSVTNTLASSPWMHGSGWW